ncbi:hypothetical protein DPMN_151170 [Dreissena polymorpha]|uniref:Uncharacterized protein n=1 Tax=Dreissena polymorpha TaxID=45954 RepID=A0A9D4J718_DREPO|nr:hypothetical protein DPMN_151170 [Dreissena polymorpha]
MISKGCKTSFCVTSRVITRKTAPPPGSHVFQQTRTIFKLIQYIFHEDWTINVTSRVLTRFYYTLKPYKFREDWTKNVTSRETATPPGSHVFQPTRTIFELVQDIVITNVLTKLHEDWTINVTSRVLTRFYYSHNDIRKTTPPPDGNVFHPTRTIFELVQDIIWTHIGQKNVTSRVLTRKTATPPGSHVCQPTGTIFELVQNIIETHVLTKFHED